MGVGKCHNRVFICLFLLLTSRSVASDSFVTPMDCSPPDSFVHGILQARILEWVAMPCSRGSGSISLIMLMEKDSEMSLRYKT